VLTRLNTTFSRDGPEKVYVQHLMCEHTAEIWRWIGDGAYIYVCGDASAMARDVNDTLCALIASEGRMSDAQAQLELGQLSAARRYCRDVY
jgi:sulfite reductase (NADPH) flavoprotein alpha-component